MLLPDEGIITSAARVESLPVLGLEGCWLGGKDEQVTTRGVKRECVCECS